MATILHPKKLRVILTYEVTFGAQQFAGTQAYQKNLKITSVGIKILHQATQMGRSIVLSMMKFSPYNTHLAGMKEIAFS